MSRLVLLLPAAVARVLLRHSDVRLTLEIYTDLVPKDAAEGIAKLRVVPPGVPNLVPNDAQTGTSSRPRGSMPLKRSQGHADTCASEHDPAPVPRVGLEPTGNGAEIEDCSASAGVQEATVPPGVPRNLRAAQIQYSNNPLASSFTAE